MVVAGSKCLSANSRVHIIFIENFMCTKKALSAVVAISLFSLTALAIDVDMDGVPDELETQLLSTLAPVVYADQTSDKPPLSLDYYVRHVRLGWFSSPKGAWIGDTGKTPLTGDLI